MGQCKKKYERQRNLNKASMLEMNSWAGANRKLQRLFIKFLYVKSFGNKCYRCGEALIGDYHIDHKEGWLEAKDPRKSFFDVDNLSLSHPGCNASHTSRRKQSD